MKRILLLGAVSALVACSGSGDDGDDNINPPVCFDVSGNETVAGLDIRRPEEPVRGCTGIDGSREDERVCMEKTPDLSCHGEALPTGVDRTPVMVTFTGCVSSFGLEAQSDDLTVTILLEETNGAATDPGYVYDGTPAEGRDSEKTTAAFVGQVRSTAVPATQCTDEGAFSIENVPTETPLIVRVTDQHLNKADRQYVDTYQYNVILRNDLLRSGPTEGDPLVMASTCTSTGAGTCYVVDEVNTVFETTFTTIALTAGVSNIEGDDDLYDGMGQGHVAGEIQDCTSDDTMKNAVVSLSNAAKKLAYFNVDFPPAVANLEDPKVDQLRTRTNADGLYAAIAVDSQDGGQEITIGAAVTREVCKDGVCACNADGTKNEDPAAGPDVLVLGTRNVFVYPDSITILTFDELMYRTR